MAKLNRKKAMAAMVLAHGKVQSEAALKFLAEGMTSKALFAHREEIISKIMAGHEPGTVISDAIDTCIRMHRVSTNNKLPSFRDLMSEEDLKLLKDL